MMARTEQETQNGNRQMTTLYKLTDRDGYTRRGDTGETLWVPGRSLTTDGGGNLCGPGFIHAYTDPLLGVFSIQSTRRSKTPWAGAAKA